jgi:four helix bundle protein
LLRVLVGKVIWNSFFLEISQSSAIEVLSMLYVLEDLSYMEISKLQQIREKTEEVKGLTLGLIAYLRRRK